MTRAPETYKISLGQTVLLPSAPLRWSKRSFQLIRSHFFLFLSFTTIPLFLPALRFFTMRLNPIFLITAFVSATAFASPLAVNTTQLEARVKTGLRPDHPVEVHPQIVITVNADTVAPAVETALRQMMTLLQNHLQQAAGNSPRTFPPLVIRKRQAGDTFFPAAPTWVPFLVTGLEPECRTRCTGAVTPVANPRAAQVDALDVRLRYRINLTPGAQNPVHAINAI
ncbi:hypothetical protein GYMLUDRAFT_254652 [Collybiopsis luxurians FD-317 M1]|nr:hypothetical protein GYMLUDRAFT_254652 [Collybiopsis luxurians FD-317 M1]